MFCPKCGKEVPPGSAVCPFCGEKLASGSPQVDLSNIGGMVSSFDIKAIDNLLSIIGCACSLLATFLPVISVSFLVSVSANLFQVGGAAVFWALLILLSAIGGAVLLILQKDKLYMGCAGLNAVISLIAIISIIGAINDSEGLGHIGFGFFFLLAGAILMVVGAVMKLRKN